MRDLSLAERSNLVGVGRGAVPEHDPGADLFSVLLVGHAEHLHVGDLGVRVEEFLNLAWIDVLAAPDHHVLHSSDDVAVTLGVKRRQIAGMHPAVGVNGLGRLVGVVPVALHHRVAPGAEFARRPWRHRATVLVDDLDLDMGEDASDGRDAPFDRVGWAGLERHGAGLGHAVGDGHLAHVHLVDDVLHDRDRARRAGHDAGAQAAEVERVEVRMAKLGDKHRGHAVERGAALRRDGLQHGARVEGVAWIDHGCANRDAGQVPKHHAEAVVQRHGNADPVLFGEALGLAGEVAVVQDALVRECRPLREAGGARCELDVDGVVGLQATCDRVQAAACIGPSEIAHIAKRVHAGRRVTAEPDDRVQVWQLRGPECTRPAVVDLRSDRANHGHVVRRLECVGGDKRLALDLVERVFKLVQPVGGVDVHQDEPDTRRGELGDGPFRTVRSPDTDAVARLQSERKESGSQRVHLGCQLGPGPAHPLVTRHQRVARTPPVDCPRECRRDGLVDQRHVGRARHVAAGQRGHDERLYESPPDVNGGASLNRGLTTAHLTALHRTGHEYRRGSMS